jgi:hypothetical protein
MHHLFARHFLYRPPFQDMLRQVLLGSLLAAVLLFGIGLSLAQQQPRLPG